MSNPINHSILFFCRRKNLLKLETTKFKQPQQQPIINDHLPMILEPTWEAQSNSTRLSKWFQCNNTFPFYRKKKKGIIFFPLELDHFSPSKWSFIRWKPKFSQLPNQLLRSIRTVPNRLPNHIAQAKLQCKKKKKNGDHLGILNY